MHGFSTYVWKLFAIRLENLEKTRDKELENEGYIYSVRAKGFFVAPKDNVKNTDVLFKALRETVQELYYLGAEEKELLETEIDESNKPDFLLKYEQVQKEYKGITAKWSSKNNTV